jgi:uncharacterized protein YjbI with pentapeptide repeats
MKVSTRTLGGYAGLLAALTDRLSKLLTALSGHLFRISGVASDEVRIRRRDALLVVGFTLFAVLAAFELLMITWHWYHNNTAKEDIKAIATFAGATVVAWAALRQAKTARLRHEEQTEADRQRRITESFSKAAEQLGSDKLEVRLGGIYTMERISRESPADYWSVMETLTAFVREKARWKDTNEEATSTHILKEPPTDIAAVLSVIGRRDETNREREKVLAWRIDLRRTDLRGAHLETLNFERVCLNDAHLERSTMSTHLENAMFYRACLQGAYLGDAHLEQARMYEAHLEGATLARAHLKDATLEGAYLKGADLRDAHLEGADLSGAIGLAESELAKAQGDARTKLPNGMTRPRHWPPAEETPT